jgi:IPT/TIG domain
MGKTDTLVYVHEVRKCRTGGERRCRLEAMIDEDRALAAEVIRQLLSDGLDSGSTAEVLGLIASHRLKVDPNVVHPYLADTHPTEVRRAALPALGFLSGPSAFRDIAPFLTHHDPAIAGAAVDGLMWFRSFSMRRMESAARSAVTPSGLEAALTRFRGVAEATAAASITPAVDVAFFLRDASGANTPHIEVRGAGFWDMPGQNDESDFQTQSTETDDEPFVVSSGPLFQSPTMYAGTMRQSPLPDNPTFAILGFIRGFNGEFIESFGIELQSKTASIVASVDEVPVQNTLNLSFQHNTDTNAAHWFVSGDNARFLDQQGVEQNSLGQLLGPIISQVSMRGKSPGFLNETVVRLAVAFGFLVDVAFLRFTVGRKLPDLTTDEGLFVRLLISELRLPGDPGFDAAQGRRAMEAMQAVVNNRLHNDPGRFGAPSATDIRQIILAPGQFHGFSGSAASPSLSADVQAKIDRLLTPGDPGLTAASYQFLRNALEVAGGAVTDPFAQFTEVDGVVLEGKTYAWTEEADPPLPDPFVKIPGGVIAGKQFFGRKKIIPLEAFLELRTYNPVSRQLEPLPAGIPVDLVDHNTVLPNTVLQTKTTDASGRVEFRIPNIQDLPKKNPDVFFVVRPGEPNALGLPGDWSTRGWTAADGSPGFFPGFNGQPIGQPGQPVVFGIGVDVHLKLVYTDRSKSPSVPTVAPPVIKVRLVEKLNDANNPGLREIRVLSTDGNGEVHNVLLDIGPEQTIVAQVLFETDDGEINLPAATVRLPLSSPSFNQGWLVTLDDSIATTSVGTVASPMTLATDAVELDAAFYMLKLLREHQTFFFAITCGAWQGVEDLTLSLGPVAGILDEAFSWPVGRVNIPEAFFFERKTIIHELTHQVVWKEAEFSSAGVAFEALFRGLTLRHHPRFLAEADHAFLEGWPEFIAAIFTGAELLFSGSRCHPVSTPPLDPLDPFAPPDNQLFGTREDGCPVLGTIGPPPLNQGERVEGALAIALLRLYKTFVVGGADPEPSPLKKGGIAETPSDGDVRVQSPWLNDPQVRAHFLQIIWEPLGDLAPLDAPTSTDLMEKTRARNSTTWHRLRQELNALRVAMAAPILTGVSPSTAPANAVQPLTLAGDEFVEGMSVTIGGHPATNVQVNSSTQLTADSPALAPGIYDVAVTTPGGTTTLPGFLSVA